MINVNPLVQWWVTPKLPPHDIFEKHNFISQWLIHPIKRRLARYYLKLLQSFTSITVIGVTGSAGKSSTVQMMASILKYKDSVLATPPSIDPVYNIPNTILRCKPGTKYLILEMSVEYPGEMDFYLWLAQPSIGVITNIYPTHTEFLGDVKGVKQEKAKLIESLGRGDFAILNSENRDSREIGQRSKTKIIWFGEKGDIRAENIKIIDTLRTKYELNLDSSKINILLPIMGRQFVQNSLAAAGVGYALGATLEQIKKGIGNFKPPEHRMEPIYLSNGALIIDDSYNSNPGAVEEALKTFKEVAGEREKIVVFGDMLELGSLEEEEHRRIGKIIGSTGVRYIIGVGKASKLVVDEVGIKIGKENAIWVDSKDKVVDYLLPLLKRHTITLIKGSRSIGLDGVVEDIKNEKA